jgi:hypothetical protein
LPASALPLMLGTGTVAALGGGLLGAWHVRMLAQVAERRDVPDDLGFTGAEHLLTRLRLGFLTRPAAALFTFWRGRQTGPLTTTGTGFWTRHGAGLLGLSLFVLLMAVYAPPRDTKGLSGTVTFTDVINVAGRPAVDCDGQEECLARVTVTLHPADAAKDAIWLYAVAWQGRHHTEDADLPADPVSGAPGILRVELVPTGEPGQYRTARSIPLYGQWKTVIRLHQPPAALMALPLYAPDDPAITAAKGRQILVHAGQTVPLISEKTFLQREGKDDVPTWLTATGYTVVGLFWAALLAFFGWCYSQAAHGTNQRRPATAPRTAAAAH